MTGIRPTSPWRWLTFGLAAILLFCGAASAQVVGNVATMEGTVEIGRGGAFTPASLGGDIQKGDVVRTGRPGRVRIVFQDNSVLKLGDGSELAISDQVYDANQAGGSSVLNLVRGKARSIVSDYYKDPSARFEVRTATAVSGVRGTDFVVAYDEADGETQVVGVTGKVAVSGATRPEKAVLIGGRQMTRIGRDGFVSPVQRAGDEVFRQVLDDVEFVGAGEPESITAGTTSGSTVAPPEQISAVNPVLSGGSSTVRAFSEDDIYPPDPSTLVEQPPGSVGLGEVSVPF